jgi:hypothetical protein
MGICIKVCETDAVECQSRGCQTLNFTFESGLDEWTATKGDEYIYVTEEPVAMTTQARTGTHSLRIGFSGGGGPQTLEFTTALCDGQSSLNLLGKRIDGYLKFVLESGELTTAPQCQLFARSAAGTIGGTGSAASSLKVNEFIAVHSPTFSDSTSMVAKQIGVTCVFESKNFYAHLYLDDLQIPAD